MCGPKADANSEAETAERFRLVPSWDSAAVETAAVLRRQVSYLVEEGDKLSPFTLQPLPESSNYGASRAGVS